MIKRKFISVRLLTPGMVIDQSIIDGTGRVLIHRKTALDDYMIYSLRKMSIGGVYIREGEESDEEITYNISPEVMEKIEKVKVPDRAKIELHESVKKRVAEGIQFLYSNPDSPRTPPDIHRKYCLFSKPIINNPKTRVYILHNSLHESLACYP